MNTNKLLAFLHKSKTAAFKHAKSYEGKNREMHRALEYQGVAYDHVIRFICANVQAEEDRNEIVRSTSSDTLEPPNTAKHTATIEKEHCPLCAILESNRK